MSGVERFLHELCNNPALVATVVSRPDLFPASPAGLEAVLVRVKLADLDCGMARAFALASEGVIAGVELLTDVD